jgi:hypothetical protein
MAIIFSVASVFTQGWFGSFASNLGAADGGSASREGKFRVSGVYDSQEMQYSAEPAMALYASLAVAKGHEAAPGPRA